MKFDGGFQVGTMKNWLNLSKDDRDGLVCVV